MDAPCVTNSRFSKIFLHLQSRETCAHTIKHASQGVGFGGEKGPHQKVPLLGGAACCTKRNGGDGSHACSEQTLKTRAPAVLHAQQRLVSVPKEPSRRHTKSTGACRTRLGCLKQLLLEKKTWCRFVKSAGARKSAPLQPLSAKDFFSFQHTKLVRRPSSMPPRVWDTLAKKVPIKGCHF